MRPALFGTLFVVALAGEVKAQVPGQPGTGFQPVPYSLPTGGQPAFGNTPYVMPNIFNPAYQPLSPYLNLNRGGNPAVNYFYGVRPGTVGGAGTFGGRGGMLAPGGNRAPFFPPMEPPQDPLDLPTASTGYVLPPAGHPVVFNNTLGFFPGAPGGPGGLRPGLSGAGAARGPAPKR